MIDQAAIHQGKPKLRLKFSLRTLFIINLGFAVIFAAVRIATSETPGPHVLTSPAIWILGSLGTVVLTSMGDAIGKVSGSFIGSLVGIAIWATGLWAFSVLETSFMDTQAIHVFAMTLDIAAILALDIQRAREDRRTTMAGPSLTTTLLENQRQRKQSGRSISLPSTGETDSQVTSADAT